jgi:hypothetical protein
MIPDSIRRLKIAYEELKDFIEVNRVTLENTVQLNESLDVLKTVQEEGFVDDFSSSHEDFSGDGEDDLNDDADE